MDGNRLPVVTEHFDSNFKTYNRLLEGIFQIIISKIVSWPTATQASLPRGLLLFYWLTARSSPVEVHHRFSLADYARVGPGLAKLGFGQ